jgi:hypothetical protein
MILKATACYLRGHRWRRQRRTGTHASRVCGAISSVPSKPNGTPTASIPLPTSRTTSRRPIRQVDLGVPSAQGRLGAYRKFRGRQPNRQGRPRAAAVLGQRAAARHVADHGTAATSPRYPRGAQRVRNQPKPPDILHRQSHCSTRKFRKPIPPGLAPKAGCRQFESARGHSLSTANTTTVGRSQDRPRGQPNHRGKAGVTDFLPR